MSSQPATQRVIRFGLYEFDLAGSELRKQGRKIKLQDQPFQVLAILLRRPGEVITREELQRELWPVDTFVEFDQGLNTAIKKIRQALGDSADNPRFVETIPRKGYRFIAPVEKSEGSVPVSIRRRRAPLWAFAAVVSVLLGGGIWLLGTKQSTEPASFPIPLTGYPGNEGSPSFSPDGNQVAFNWMAPGQDNFDIYIKLIGTTEPLRLTKDPADDYGPAWSPDGRWMAFLRARTPSRGSAVPTRPVAEADQSDILLIPTIGGSERKLAEVYPPSGLGPFVSWHPSGKWLVVSDKSSPDGPNALFLLSVDTGEKRRLTTPPSNAIADEDPAVSPDGQAVVFDRYRKVGVSDLYVLELSENLSPKGDPKRITFGSRYADGPAWLPDGRSVLFSSGSIHDPSLWRVLIRAPAGRPGNPERLAFAGAGARQPAISRQGRLVYAQALSDTDICRLELRHGRRGETAITPVVRLISSTRIDHTPQYSPDGQRIAFGSNRSGSHEIWVSNSDGSKPVKLTSFNGPYTAHPHWSPDSQWISFFSSPEGRSAIYVIHSDGGAPTRLTDGSGAEAVASWSQDGKWIYFSSNRTGEFQVWKVPWEPERRGSGAVQVTRNGGSLALESPDGKFLYYLKADKAVTSLWRLPLGGGEEALVLNAVHGHNFAVVDDGVYFIASPEHASVQFLNFTTARTTTIAALPRMPAYGLSVSTDGRWLLYSEYEGRGGELMLVENFR